MDVACGDIGVGSGGSWDGGDSGDYGESGGGEDVFSIGQNMAFLEFPICATAIACQEFGMVCSCLEEFRLQTCESMPQPFLHPVARNPHRIFSIQVMPFPPGGENAIIRTKSVAQ